MVAPLSEMFNHAVEDGHLTSNPAARIMRRTRSEQGHQRDRTNFLSRKEVARRLVPDRRFRLPIPSESLSGTIEICRPYEFTIRARKLAPEHSSFWLTDPRTL